MIVNYLGQRPLAVTLSSGYSLHIRPKQKDIKISGQDFYMTKKLQAPELKNLFVIIDESDDITPDELTKAPSREEITADKPVLKFDQQDTTLDLATYAKTGVLETRPVTESEKQKKRVRMENRKKIRAKEEDKLDL